MNHLKLWAKSKPRHPLWKHLLDAAAVSLALPAPAIDFGWKGKHTAFLVGLHDIGKADSTFQHQIPDYSDELSNIGYPVTADVRCRHERLSANFIKNRLIREGIDLYTADSISRTVVVHHGYWDEAARPVAPMYEDAQILLCKMLEQALDINSLPLDHPSDLSAFGMRLAGRIVLCDWIASNEMFFGDDRLQKENDPQLYTKIAKEVAVEWINDLGLDRDYQTGRAKDIVETARPIQRMLLDTDIPPGLVIIEAPMGEGKTEAAWILAEKWRDKGYHGMYMALPTMSTSDSLHSRYQDDYLKKLGREGSTKLVHGMAWLRDDKEPDKPLQIGEPGDDKSIGTAWFRPTRRAMLSAHGVGTIDQAMLAGMNVKFGFLRLYGLADRVLVIDEVHAYDAYMSAIIARLLQWCACLRIPVVLLSATLSAGQRAAMLEAYGALNGAPEPTAPYPLITLAEPGKAAQSIHTEASSNRDLRIEMHPGVLGDAKRTAEVAEALVENGGCCCVILNTVKQAQAVYNSLPDNMPKILFHSRFTAADRETITNKVLDMFGKGRWEGEGEDRKFKPAARPEKFILVATQVVEQSLDVDFDHMISEIAPIDLLLQRSGRIRRHSRTKDGKLKDKDDERGQPILHVLLPDDGVLDFGGTNYVYADKPLLRTLAILSNRSEVHLPADFRTLIECCYGSDEWEQSTVAWETVRIADQEWDKETQLLYSQGKQFALCTPSKRRFRPVNNDPVGDDSDDGNGWRAKTRLGANDHTAVLVSEDQVQRLESGELPMQEVRSLYRQSLKLPNYLPIHTPAQGYGAGVEARGKLQGLLLMPLDGSGIWHGMDEKGNYYEVTYDKKLGLLAGRMQ